MQENYAIKTLLHVQEVEIGLGEVEVDGVIGYRKIQTHSNDTMSAYKLEMPPTILQTGPLAKASGQTAGDDRRA